MDNTYLLQLTALVYVDMNVIPNYSQSATNKMQTSTIYLFL